MNPTIWTAPASEPAGVACVFMGFDGDSVDTGYHLPGHRNLHQR